MLQQDVQVNAVLGKGVWRDKPALLGVLFALSLRPLMVRSLFALCNVFVA